jgi:phage terminase small subunit
MDEKAVKYSKKELEKIMTKKMKIFCHEVIIDWNYTRAALKAGYSKKTAYATGAENMKKPQIQQYIDFIKEDIEKEAGITKLRQLKELSNIAYCSIAMFHNTWIDRKLLEEIPEEQKSAIESIETRVVNIETDKGSEKEIEQVKIKLHSKLGALTEINKMLGYHEPEKHEGTIVNINAKPSPEEIKEISDELESEV